MPGFRSLQALKRGVLRQSPRVSQWPVGVTQKVTNVGPRSRLSGSRLVPDSRRRRRCFDISGIDLVYRRPWPFSKGASWFGSSYVGYYLSGRTPWSAAGRVWFVSLLQWRERAGSTGGSEPAPLECSAGPFPVGHVTISTS